LSDDRFFLSTPGDTPLVELRHGARCVLLAPHVGGSIAAFYESGESNDGGVMHWLRPATQAMLDARNPLGMASFPLLPYCNRIRDARFTFDGERVDLSADGNLFPHALHGNAWRRPWRVDAVSESSATLGFRHEPSREAAHHWPYAFEASQEISLDANALSVTMTLRNLSDKPMPFGIGHHPYFPRTSSTRINAHVDAMWHGTPDPLPTHLAPHPGVDALKSPAGMSADAFDLDNHFVGWRHAATIAWPDEHRSIRLNAASPFDFMVIYAPAAFPSLLCVEPVSNVADWVNLDADRATAGGGVLTPGDSIRAAFSLTPCARAGCI
jgi:aldose 1-epimerase